MRSLWGVAPAGPIHFGYDTAALAQRAIITDHADHTVLFADLHVMMSHGLSYDEVRRRSAYYEAVFSAGYELDARFVRGSDFQSSFNYIETMLSASRIVTVTQLLDTLSSQSQGRRSHRTLASILYPLMQCLDAVYLEADLVLADEGQRKIYDLLSTRADVKDGIASMIELRASMLARTIPARYEYYPLMVDIAGRRLSQSNSQTRISMHEKSDSLYRKVCGMYAPPPGQAAVEGRENALLEYVRHSALPWIKLPVSIQTRDGAAVCESFSQVEACYDSGQIHPSDLKDFLFEVLLERTRAIRNSLATFSYGWIDIPQLDGALASHGLAP